MARLDHRTRTRVPDPVDADDAVNLATMQAAIGSGGGGAPDAHAATHAIAGSDPVTPASIGAAVDADVVHKSGAETISGVKTIPAGSQGQWIFNQPPQVAVGSNTNHPVRRDDPKLVADATAAQPSVRTIGTGALQAAAGTAPAAAVAAHETAGDPHPQYLTAVEGAAAFQPIQYPQRTVTAGTAVTDADRTVIVNTASNVTVTLPTAVGRAGRRFTVVKAGTGILTIDPAGTETIAGNLTETISMQWGFRELESDGAGWIYVGGKVDPIIASLADVAAGGTLTVNAAAATVYRARLMGATAILGSPTNPIDGDVINLELYPTVACALTVTGPILTGGITSPIALPAGKLWSAALRYRAATSPATAAAAWRLLASSADN